MTAQHDPLVDLEDLRTLAAKWSIDCGRRVAARRAEFGWSRRQLAELVGTTEPTILRVEQGDQKPRDHLRLAIANALCREVAELWPYPSRAEVVALREAVAGVVVP